MWLIRVQVQQRDDQSAFQKHLKHPHPHMGRIIVILCCGREKIKSCFPLDIGQI